MRTCRKCGERKPLDEFDVRADSGNRRTECRECRRSAQRKPIDRTRQHPRAHDAPTKRCTRCGEVKPVAEFPQNNRSRDKRQSWCRACFSAVNAAYYARNRERELARLTEQGAARRAENRTRIIKYLRQHPCVDCGEADIVVLEFDHHGDKLGDISTYANSGRTWSRIFREIQKCDVRCANCHRRETARRAAGTRKSRRQQTRAAIQLDLVASVITRICRACGSEKPLSSFPFRSAKAVLRHHICLSCQRELARRWYAASVNHSVRAQRARGSASRRELATRVFAYLIEHPCVDCGASNPLILDFDHRGEKIANVSTLVRDRESWDKIASEIAKCDVRCANCHRRRSVRNVNGYRLGA